MSRAWIKVDDARLACAADWLVRLQSGDLDEARAIEFDAWLAAHPANVAAYDRTLGVCLELQANATAVANDLTAETSRRRPRVASRAWLIAGVVAAAATLILAVLPTSLFAPRGPRSTPPARASMAPTAAPLK